MSYKMNFWRFFYYMYPCFRSSCCSGEAFHPAVSAAHSCMRDVKWSLWDTNEFCVIGRWDVLQFCTFDLPWTSRCPWMKTPLGTEVDLGAGHIVLDGFPALRKRGTVPLSFRPMSIVAMVVHLSYCWALVFISEKPDCCLSPGSATLL